MTDQPARDDEPRTAETPVTEDAATASEPPTDSQPQATAASPQPEPASGPEAARVPGPVTEALSTGDAVTGQPAVAPAHAAARPSALDRVRDNRMGPLAAALGVSVVVALLLSVLVPGEPNLYAYVILGLLVTAAVGFTVRYLSRSHGLLTQVTAFVATALGLHIMGVTGAIDGVSPGGLLETIGLTGPGFDDALLAALATPAVSAGGILCGLVAAIIAGWGPRETGDAWR